MKKIVSLIVLSAVSLTFPFTTEVLVAQYGGSGPQPVLQQRALDQALAPLRELERQQQAERQEKAIIFGVSVGVAAFCFIVAFYLYMKERDKKEREWREKQDEKNREFLAQKLQENKGSEPPDK